VTVTVVSPGNTAPVAVDDSSYSVAKNSSGNLLNVLANDYDTDIGDSISISLVGTPDAGGSASINGSNIDYAPLADFSGTEHISYTISDGVDTATATVTVTVVAPGNTVPTGFADSYSVIQDSTNTLNVLANDTDPDLPAQTLSIASADATSLQGGTVTNNGTDITYSPAASYTGADSFTYVVTDGTATSTSVTVNLTVLATGGNSNPTGAVDSYSVIQDSTNTLDVLANDTDPDLPAQTLSIASADAASAQGGTVTNNGTDITYTPAASYTGPDSFTYTVTDGTATSTSVTVSLTVLATGGNTAPTAVNDSNYSVAENSSANLLNVLVNDYDEDLPAQTLTIDSVSAAGNGTTSTDGSTISYTPNMGFSGPETFTYIITDGSAFSLAATVTVNVVAADTAPTGAVDSYSVIQDSTNTLDVLANDSDVDVPAQSLTIDSADVTVYAGGELYRCGQLHLRGERRHCDERLGDGQRDGARERRQHGTGGGQ